MTGKPIPHEAVYEVRCPVRGCKWSVTANVADLLEDAWRAHRALHVKEDDGAPLPRSTSGSAGL